jgi:hypothetical protein
LFGGLETAKFYSTLKLAYPFDAHTYQG